VQTVPLPPLYPRPAGAPATAAGSGDPRPAPPQPPFVLSLDEQRQLDQVLTAWEQRNKEVKRFECNVTRWRYDSVFGNGKQPEGEPGVIKYAAPDKGMVRIDGKQPMHWICDGRAIYSYEYATGKGEKNKVHEYSLPPELQGKGIADGPLPFVFGTEAQKLKQRYFLRLMTPRDQGEIWLEAQPRFQRDAADFSKAELILKADGMQPFAVQLTDPNRKDRTVYQFDKVIINRRPFPLEPDPFRPTVPFGWQKVVEQAPAQAARTQVGGSR
jgi:TIGR03009 family protein